MVIDINYLLLIHGIFFESPNKGFDILTQYPDHESWEKNCFQISQTITTSEFQRNRIQTLGKSNFVQDQLTALKEKNVKIIAFFDPNYPSLLKHIPDPPLVLYYKGDIALTEQNFIGVVGPRQPSDYGRTVAKQLTKDLCHYFGIASGMAAGIDTIAHQVALAEHRPTIAVMGTSFDTIYPSSNQALFQELSQNGLVLSEYPFGISSKAHFFSRRNRLITGLSRGVLVCEAAEKSGALVSARYAIEQNREVFAVPGSIYSEQSVGVHRLLQDGAKLVTSIEDILSEYYDINETSQEEVPEQLSLTLENLSEDEAKIMSTLQTGKALGLDELSQKSGLLIHQLLMNLTVMEMNGLIKSHPGQVYSKP